MIDPRTPVIVGVAQLTARPEDLPDVGAAREPVDLMAEVVRRADADAGGRSLVSRIDTIWVPQPLSRRYPDPGLLVGRRLGVEEARSVRAVLGGNSPQLLANEAAAAVARGESDVAVVTGAEAMYSRFRAKEEGVELDWERSDLAPCPHEVGDARPGTTADEERHGASLPIRVYPLLETAVRARRGRGVQQHQVAVSELWSRLAQVAAANPHAWSRRPYTPEEIRTPSPDNRMITFPYTKRMCANMAVDQAAALLLTSYGTARDAGVPDERLVFPHAGADAHDHFFVSERWSLAESPAIRAATQAVLETGGHGVDDVARFDIYSCFPSAVQVAVDALGLAEGDERPVSLTGGLALFGGPGNNYTTHALAEAVEWCRRDPGSYTLVTGVGWYLTKHSAGLYSTVPPRGGFVRVDPARVQAEVDSLPRRTPTGRYEGDAEVEATAVAWSRDDEPELGIVSLIVPSGARVLANSEDSGVLRSMTTEAWEGRRVRVRAADGTNGLDV